MLFKGVELFGNITYVDARILSDPTWAGTNPLTGLPDTVVGKRVPYVPDWRSTFGVTYRPDTHWAFTVAVSNIRPWTTPSGTHLEGEGLEESNVMPIPRPSRRTPIGVLLRMRDLIGRRP